MPWPSDVAPSGASRSIAASTSPSDARGLLDHEASVAEGDHTDLDGLGLRLHEGSGRRLGGVDAGGLEILGAHAVRHVEGEDDGALLPGQAQRSSPGGRTRRAAGRDRSGRRRRARDGADGARRAEVVGTKPCSARAAARCVPAAHQGQIGSDQQGGGEQQHQHAGPDERHQRRRLRRSSTMRSSARTRSSWVDTSWISTAAWRADVSRSARRASVAVVEAAAELGIAGVDRQQLARLGILDDDETGVGQLELAGIGQRGSPPRSWRSPSRANGALPAGLADEVGDDHDDRAALDRAAAARNEAARGRWPCPSGTAGRSRWRVSRSTWLRPLRGGIIRSTALL